MPNDNSATIVSKVWNYPPSLCELRRPSAHVLKNAGVGYGDYVEQITYLLLGSILRIPGFAQPYGLPVSLQDIGNHFGLPVFANASILKLAPPSLKLRQAGSEMTELGFDPPSLRYGRARNPIPDAFQWSELSSKSGDELEVSGATVLPHMKNAPFPTSKWPQLGF